MIFNSNMKLLSILTTLVILSGVLTDAAAKADKTV